MKYITCISLIFVALIVNSNSTDLPANFNKCSRSSPTFKECISKSATEAIISLAPGLKSFKILPLDPLAVDGVSIGETGGAVSIKQNYKNVKLHGLTKGMKVDYYDMDFDNFVFRCNSINDKVDFVADYTMSGQILLLPIRGNGQANITMLGLKSKNDIYWEKYEKNGESYLRVTKYEIKFSPEKVILNFTNLFNGDAVLSKQMNIFLNANSDLVFKETQAAYEETFGLVFAKIANDIFSRVPMNKIFLE